MNYTTNHHHGTRRRMALIAPFGLQTKGTTAARVIPIAQVLAQSGHDVRVIIPPWDDPPGSDDLALKHTRREMQHGVELVFVPVRPGPSPLAIPLRLVREALAFRPDITYVFKPKAYSGLAALLLALLQKPFLLDTDDWEGRGGYNDTSPYSRPQKWLFGWQEHDLPHRARVVTVASRTLQTQAWGFGVPAGQVVYLPNGISPAKYAGWTGPAVEQASRKWRQKLGLPEDGLTLLAYTRFLEFEPERLINIWRLTLARLPAPLAEKTRLLVVGGGFYGEDQGLTEGAARVGLAHKLIQTGTVALSELPAILRCGDIALFPFDDNLINRSRCSAKFLDLLMAQRPVVSEAVGELANYLEDGVGGYLVPPDDTAAFAHKVVQLAVLPAGQRQEIGEAGATRLQAKYNWNQLILPLERQLGSIVPGS